MCSVMLGCQGRARNIWPREGFEAIGRSDGSDELGLFLSALLCLRRASANPGRWLTDEAAGTA